MVIGWPHGQHPVAGVEVPATDVVEVLAGEPIASRLTAPILEFADDAERGLAPTTAEYSDLPVSNAGQRDLGRRVVSRFRNAAISALRSSPSGTTRPAR